MKERDFQLWVIFDRLTVSAMSAFPPIATDLMHHGDGRKGPLSAARTRSKSASGPP